MRDGKKDQRKPFAFSHPIKCPYKAFGGVLLAKVVDSPSHALKLLVGRSRASLAIPRRKVVSHKKKSPSIMGEASRSRGMLACG